MKDSLLGMTILMRFNSLSGSVGSIVESSSCSKISKSESSFDSNQSVAGSAVGDRDTDFQGNESDIEILSNPSQSSIEVLDSHHSSRKHSEERRNFEVPILPELSSDISLAVPFSALVNRETSTHDLTTQAETTKPKKPKVKQSAQPKSHKLTSLKNAPLTESSSSGSVTDSICTAYENQTSDENGIVAPTEKTSDKSANSSGEKEKTKTLTTSKSEVSVIGSMFSHLLQLGGLTPKVETVDPTVCEPYKFSYEDFRSVDHRLKLYLYQSVFDDEAELKWLVRGRIYDENGPDTPGFLGLLVISTTKFYVLKAEKEER